MTRALRRKFRAWAIAILIGFGVALDAALPCRASPADDAYIAGYAAAILERDFMASSAVVDVRDGVVRLREESMPPALRPAAIAALSRIPGVRRVELAAAPSEPSGGDHPPSEPAQVSASAGLSILPSRRLFEPLTADPRWPHFGASFLHINGSPEVESGTVVSLGESIPLLETPAPGGGRWQIGILGAVFSLFDRGSASQDLINNDYFVGVPVSWRRDRWSAQARYYHQSSHLGDELLLRGTGLRRVNFSLDTVDFLLSRDVDDRFRVYGGGGVIVRSEPTLDKLLAQLGGEYVGSRPFLYGLLRPVAAIDLQAREFQEWTPDLSLRAGVQIDSPFAIGRKVQLLIEYYRGKSPYGQFFNQNIESYGVGVHFYF